MWGIGQYYGSQLNPLISGSYLVYLVPGKGSENVGSKGCGGTWPVHPGFHPFAVWKISLKPGQKLPCLRVPPRHWGWGEGEPSSPISRLGVSSSMLSIASHLLAPRAPSCCLPLHTATAQAEMHRSTPAAPYTSATLSHWMLAPHRPVPSSTASQPVRWPRPSPVGTTQKWQLLSASAGLVQRSLAGKFYWSS